MAALSVWCDASEVVTGHIIGNGKHADVLKGTWKDAPVALRRMRCAKRRGCHLELQELMALRHPNVMRFHGFYVDVQLRLVGVVELGCMDLFDATYGGAEGGGCDKVRSWCTDILRGLVYLHSRNVVHLDVKAENCLIMECQRAVLADLDFARRDGERLDKPVGTITCLAPELLGSATEPFAGVDASPSMDVWTFALMAMELIMGRQAYTHMAQMVDSHGNPFAPPPMLESMPRGATRDILGQAMAKASVRTPSAELLAKLVSEWTSPPPPQSNHVE
jgi:serine/threonine protein kinase